MSTDPDTILLEAEEAMSSAVDYLGQEFRGIRTGRASTAIVDYVKVDYYGSMTDLKSLAAVSVPEPTQIVIKPFDASSLHAIKQAIESASLGLNPIVEAKQIRINIPPLSRERREQLAAQAKKLAEQQKVVCRNTRRDANKSAEALGKGDHHISEDEVSTLKEEIQELLKKYESRIDELTKKKSEEIMEI